MLKKEVTPLPRGAVNTLYTRGIINHATWTNVLRAFRGESTTHLGQYAIRTCEVAIEALVECAVDAAYAVIQEKLGVKTGDLAATVLSDGMIERELTRYVYAALAMGDQEKKEGVP